MLKIISRYIASNILSSTLLALLVLLGLYTFMDFVTELDDLGKGNYQIREVLIYIFMTMPKRIYELLPVIALLGSVIGLGNMASQSELVAIRSAGVSIADINKSVVFVAVLLMLLAFFIGEVVRPYSEQAAQEFQSRAQTGTEGSRSSHGIWTRDGNHFNHIERINSDGSFSDVIIYEFDQHHRLRTLTKAESAVYQTDHWLMTNVVKSIIDVNGVSIRSIKEARWETQLNVGMLNIVIVPPEFLPVWNLMEYIDYLKDNRQAYSQYELAFWRKVMMPLSTAVMVLLAVPFIFGPLRSVSVGGRIFAGVMLGVGFHLFNQTFQRMGLVYDLAPLLSVSIPTVIFGSIAWWMMRRIH